MRDVEQKSSFAIEVNRGLNRLFTFKTIPARLDADMFVFRTRGEESYVDNLATITTRQLERWTGRFSIDPAALKFVQPQLHVNFRFLKKGLSPYWKDEVRPERRFRCAYGWFLPWHITHHSCFRRARCNEEFMPIHPEWSSIEVPKNCPVELPPVLSYMTSQLLNPQSGWWVVAATEFAAKTAAFLLFEVYDNFRLWSVPQFLIDCIKTLPL